MSDEFKSRLSKGEEAIEELKDIFVRHGIEYAQTGYEFWNSSNGFTSLITKNNDESSRLCRFYPDMVVPMSKRSYLIEVKNSSGIERECYDELLKFEEKYNVLLFLKHEGDFKVVRPSKLRFSDPVNYARKYLTPVDGYWVCPSMMTKEEYSEYKKKNPNTSGNDFAFIDWNQTEFKGIDVFIEYAKR